MDKDIWKPKGTSRDHNVLYKLVLLGKTFFSKYGSCSCIAAIPFVSLK